MRAKRNNCMFALPHELTGMGTVCALFGDNCNGHGIRCGAYQPHDKYTRKTLANAIAEKKKKRGRKSVKESNNA